MAEINLQGHCPIDAAKNMRDAASKKFIRMMHPVGFEPTPPKGTELESVALDHSATDALNLNCSNTAKIFVMQPAARFELATPCLRNRCNNRYAVLAYT